MENNTLFDKLEKKYPFLSVCKYSDKEIVGIIQNRSDSYTTIYDFGALPNMELKEKFLELGEIWWWESNRMIPINIFLKGEWSIFTPYAKTYTNKYLEVLSGPCCSLNEILHSRKKRKSITLVKKIEK